MRLLALAFVLLTPSFVCAQIAGVPVDSLTPDGMDRVDVSLPYHGGVELFFAPRGQSQASVRLDVEVASDAVDAADAEQWFVNTSTGALPRLSGIGDHARGSHELVAFTRDNVFVVVRGVTGPSDCVALARHIDHALRLAPRRLPAAVGAAVPRLTPGVNALQFPADVLVAHVEAGGSATARQTRSGWVVSLADASSYSLSVLTCDRWLRRRVTTVDR